MGWTGFDRLLHPAVVPQHLLTFLTASGLLTCRQGRHVSARKHIWNREDNMDTHLLMTGVAVMVGLIGIAASRDLLRRLRPQPRLVPIRVERPQRHSRDM